MSDWKQKRFWKSAAVTQLPDGFTVELDGRRVKTPAKAALLLPTRSMAEAVATEWQAQEDAINPATMPFTRSANAAIDKVAHQHGEVAQMLADYGDSDLLCYRADGPRELVARQDATWTPALDWAEQALGARLQVRNGVIHRPQTPQTRDLLARRVRDLDPFQLAAFHDLVSLSGSLVLGFAAAAGWRPIGEIWAISRVDEDWQEEQWGRDDEAHATTEIKRNAFEHAKRFWDCAAVS